MSEWDQFDNLNNENEGKNAAPDTYTTENSEDIYNTPNVMDDFSKDASDADPSAESVTVERITDAEVVVENTESAADAEVVVENASTQDVAQSDAVIPYNNPYGGQPRNGGQGNPYNYNPYNPNPYSNQYNGNAYGNNQYNNNQYGNNQYNNNQYNNLYGNNQYNNPYDNNQHSGNPYSNNQYGSNPYSGSPYGSNPYGGQPQNDGQGNPYSGSPYGGQAAPNNNPYNYNPYGGQGTPNNNPSGTPPYNNNQFSPYAMPPKKNKNGLIIGIVVAVVILFLIAVFALAYKAVTLLNQDDDRARNDREEYRFDDDDDDWGVERKKKNPDPDYDDRDDHDDYDDWYDDYYDDDWYDDYDDYYYDDEYYDLHDDIRWDLSYTVDFESYEIDDGDMSVLISYPVIDGDDVPNLRKLNEAILDEVDFLKDLASDAEEGDEFTLIALAYVTYMDEEKMSIVFRESIYTEYEVDYYLYSLNIDTENGVVLDNQSIVNANDDFSIEFRERSDIQNGESSSLDRMTDQEITKHFNSSDIIVFYTPMGMEIGFNHDEGWITVTYQDYEKYLKVF